MKAARSISMVMILWFASAAVLHAGEPLPQAEYFRETPGAWRLLTNQWSAEPSRPAAYALEFLRTADQQTARLTLRDAVYVGLKNNPGIEVERLEPFRAAEQTWIEKSVFDPTLNLEFRKDYTVDPSGATESPFFQPVQTTQNRDLDLSLRKFLRSGAQLEISFLNNRFFNTLPHQVLRPQYRPQLGFSLTQPLLRDFGWGLATIFVRIAENREEISLFNYQSKLAQLVQRITEAYWAVVYARENLIVRRKGVELADVLLRNAESRVRTGALARVAVIEAQAEKARREELVIIAENDLATAGADLRLTLNLNPESTFLPRTIEPIDPPSVEPVAANRAATLENALTRRPELLASAMTVQNQLLQSRYAENQLLPRLDLRAGAGLTGIAGELKPPAPGNTNPFPGNYPRSLERLANGDFYNYGVGVALQIPLGNGRSRGEYAQARIELAQAQARQRDLAAQITLEVERAVGDVEANIKRIQTTRRARELAAENLRGQERRFEVGLVTQKDVIDFQSRLLDAEAGELRAVTDYNNSISRLRLSEGTLLRSYNVEVESPTKPAEPWWAKF